MKVITVFGTRPEMIKLWSTIYELENSRINHITVHTGQNYTPELKDKFFDDLSIRSPDYSLSIRTGNYAEEISDILIETDKIFYKEKPDVLVVLGDTYSGMCALSAKRRGIKVVHMEAGLRSYDARMPEQMNRKILDHIADLNLVFHSYHRENLLREGIHPGKILITGNPTFETLRHFKNLIDKSSIINKLELNGLDYFLVTAHRTETVDDPVRLTMLIESLIELRKKYGVAIIFPMHPRTFNKLDGVSKRIKLDELKIIKPLGYFDYNKLAANAKLLLGDSGTTPEEGLFFNVPVISLRDTTERIETLEAGGHIVSGLSINDILDASDFAISSRGPVRYDLMNGLNTGQVVVNSLLNRIKHFF
jgi:UDP-N-acetylglucosamine 2-epimerase (non-hydrolysing)